MLVALAVAALATPALPAPVRLLSVEDSTAAVVFADEDVVALSAAADDGSIAARAENAGFSRVERGLGPGPGTALLTRLPVEARDVIPFQCRPFGAVFARLKTPAGELDVYRARFARTQTDAPCRAARLQQAFELVQAVERLSAGRPFVIMHRYPAWDDPAYLAVADMLGLTGVGDGRLFVAAGAETLVDARARPGAVSFALRPELLAVKPAPDKRRRADALQRVANSLDARVDETFARDRWSWLPVYGLALQIRDERERRRLDAARVDADTERILTLEARR